MLTNFLLFHRLLANSKCEQQWDDITVETFHDILSLLVALDRDRVQTTCTFDDGYDSDFLFAAPMLEQKSFRGFFFVVPDLVGKPGYMDWSMIKELTKRGHRIGSHSLSHIDLTTLNLTEVDFQLVKSKEMIEDQTGKVVDMFSFPFGRFNSALIDKAHLVGYSRVFTSKRGLSNLGDSALKRNGLNLSMSTQQIKNVLSPTGGDRLKWAIQDGVKDSIKNMLPLPLYRAIRDTVFK